MSEVIFPTQIPDGTPASDDRLLLSDTSDSGAAIDVPLSALPISTATQAALDAKESTANKGVANGYAPLDATGKVPAANLPAASGTGDVVGPASATDNAVARYDGTTGKLVQNSTVTLSDSGNLAGLGELHFSLSPTPSAYAEGTLRWNTTDKCLDIEVGNGSTLQTGQEIFVRVRNATGSTIANGALCYINGTTGNRPTVALAKADAEATSHTLIGMSTDNIADNADGFITVLGTVNDLDTSAFAGGAELFLSATTAGAFVTTAPSAPNYVVKVGTVSRSHGVNGKILVQPQVRTVSASNVRGQLPATQVSFDPTGTTLSATEIQSAIEELSAEKIQEPTNAYATGYVLTWNGTEWVGQENTPAVGSASKFYLDATATIADNLALSTSPSTFPETTISVPADVGIGGGVSFLERFVSGPLGRTSIPAGNWDFSTFGSVSAVTGTNFIHTRINRRSELTGMTATFTGTGTTRTLTVTGGTPFVAGDANASILAATLVETPNQTCWISGFTSSSVVTVTLTDAGYVNEVGTPLSALYYRLFLASSADIAATGIQEFSYSTTQPEFTGLNPTDRIVAAYFCQTDSGTARTFTLYYGGTARFSSFESPIKTLHSDLMGLAWNESGHTGTANKLAGFGASGEAVYVDVPTGGSSLWTTVTGTRTSDTTFTLTGDQTAIFSRGLVIKWTESSSQKCGYVVSSSYSAPDTTVTIIGDVMSSIDASSLKWTAIPAQSMRFAVAGSIGTVATDVANTQRATEPLRVLGANLWVGSAGTTNSTTIDLNKAGTTMFTTKPSLASTVAYSSAPFTVDSGTSLAVGDAVTEDVDGVQTTPAVDLYSELITFPSRILNLA